MHRRFTLLLALAAALPLGAAAQPAYPGNAPIRMLVGNPAGGTTDVVARLIAVKLGEQMRGAFIVDNKPGASGLIAAESVAKGTPDGYTLLMASSQLATFKALYPASTFDAERDLEPIGIVATSPYVMVVHPSLPVKTVPELLAYAKAHPGQISYAGSSPGTAQHLGWELIKRSTGTDMQYVPYKGTGALMPDLLAGRLQAGIDNVAILTPYIKAGQLRGIAVTSAKPSPLLPDLPTVAAGGVPDFAAMGWFILYAPARTPPAVLAALRQGLQTVMAAPETREKLVGIGSDPQSGAAEEARALLKRETTVWGKVIKDAGITAQ
ncbi:tripartite tricarboxylate transporter substrate binding protein [Xylophilus rhododendri]|uniref:Tripartite tricarboxylate transporter substrate binding protein n=1 Tax=Xylophilus rhododendri TaxID=2697032 RepID=A0A857IYF9_9BURK|nr:tripartite tricarboxylate transporter substrate binding protein [Xylophilus rhododendri]QHI96590.1 tripartite tricarboxylate transporter substrate binding protein [Xylophilus rhododendri]